MTYEDMTDAKMLEAVRAGDEEAFLQIYRQHQGGIYRFALRMSGDQSLAEDVTQEVFMSLIGGGVAAVGYDSRRGPLRSYLFGIVRNLVLRRLQSRGRWVPLPEDDHELEVDGALPVGPGSGLDDGDDPLRWLTRQETIEAVRQSILTLPSHYREVIILCDLHEMSYQEATEILECSTGTIRSRLHRGRALLLERLRADSGAELKTGMRIL